MKTFKSRSSKANHKKNVKCIPCEPLTETPETVGCTINNITNNNNNITNNNNTNIDNSTTINYILNWADEMYGHVSPTAIANLLVTKCRDNPLNFFTEFPRLAHKDEHANVKCTNMRGEYMDVYQDGSFRKIQSDIVLNDSSKRMCHRVDDAYNEDEAAFRRCKPVTEAIVYMEDVINESGDEKQ